MSDLKGRLGALRPKIEELMALAGTPGLSLSVMIAGDIVHQQGYGFSDLENKLPVTEHTIFPACSLTKAVTAAITASLVEDGLATWDTLVKDVVPSFSSKDPFLTENVTLTDLLCHRSGLTDVGNLVNGCEGNVLLPGADCMRVINDQTLCLPFRQGFQYNSTAYDLSGEAIQALSGKPLHTLVQERIFDVLDMKRSYFKTPPANVADVAKCYNALDDGTPFSIPSPKIGDDGTGAASGGMRSCAGDLLKLYRAFLISFNDQCSTGLRCTPGSPLKQVPHLMSARIPMFPTSRYEATYGLGWARVQLPAKIGSIGLNGRLIPEKMPVVGKGAPGQLVIYHQGTLPGALASVLLLPDLDAVILVLSNSLALTDVPDWVSQLVLEELLNVPQSERHDYFSLAKESIRLNLEWYPSVIRGLESQRRESKASRELEAFVGTYIDSTGVFKNVVTLENGVLHWAFQGLDSERFELHHYEYNTFTWLLPRNELSKRGRWVLGGDQGPEYWKATFKVDSRGDITSLFWRHNLSMDPVEYRKAVSR